jgi:hypothetical protein
MNTAAYRVRIADPQYCREQIKCQFACPVHPDARVYERAIVEIQTLSEREAQNRYEPWQA